MKLKRIFIVCLLSFWWVFLPLDPATADEVIVNLTPETAFVDIPISVDTSTVYSITTQTGARFEVVNNQTVERLAWVDSWLQLRQGDLVLRADDDGNHNAQTNYYASSITGTIPAGTYIIRATSYDYIVAQQRPIGTYTVTSNLIILEPTPAPPVEPSPTSTPSAEPQPSPTPTPEPLPQEPTPAPSNTPQSPEPSPTPSPQDTTPAVQPEPEPQPAVQPSVPPTPEPPTPAVEPTPTPEPEAPIAPEPVEPDLPPVEEPLPPEPEMPAPDAEEEPAPIPVPEAELPPEPEPEAPEPESPSIEPLAPPIVDEVEPTPSEEEKIDNLVDDAQADGKVSEEERVEIASALVEAAAGEPISAADIIAAGIDYADLPDEQPVELANGVVLVAEVVAALELFSNPAELVTELFSDPAMVLTALSNIGADMSPEVREEAEDAVVAAVIVSGIATQASMTAAVGSAGYRRRK